MTEKIQPLRGDLVCRPGRPVWPRWRSGLMLVAMIVVAGKLYLPPHLFTDSRAQLTVGQSQALQNELQTVVQQALNDSDYTLEEYGRDHWRVVTKWDSYVDRYQVSHDLLMAATTSLHGHALNCLMAQQTRQAQAAGSTFDGQFVEENHAALNAAKVAAAPAAPPPPQINWSKARRNLGKLYLIGLMITLPLLLLRPFEAATSWGEGWNLLRLTWHEAVLSIISYPICFNSYWPDRPIVLELVDALASERGSTVRLLTYQPNYYRQPRNSWPELFKLPDCPIWRQAYAEIMPPSTFKVRWPQPDIRPTVAVCQARWMAVRALWQQLPEARRQLVAGWMRWLHRSSENQSTAEWVPDSPMTLLGRTWVFTQELVGYHRLIGRVWVATLLAILTLPLAWGNPAYGQTEQKERVKTVIPTVLIRPPTRPVLTGLYAEFVDNPGDRLPPSVILNAGVRLGGRVQNLWMFGVTGRNPVFELDTDCDTLKWGDLQTSWGPYLGYGLGHHHIESGGLYGFESWKMDNGSSIVGPWYAGFSRHNGWTAILPNTRWLCPVGPDVYLGLGMSLTVSADTQPSWLIGPVVQAKLGEQWTLRMRVAADPRRPADRNELRFETFTRF